MNAKTVMTAAIPALAVVGIGYLAGKKQLDDLLKKSVVLSVADDAPAAIKLALSDLRLSVKVRDLYDAATKPGQPGTVSSYFKVTLQ